MQLITLQQQADFFDLVTIEQTIDTGATLAHICNMGTAERPCRYLLVSDNNGRAVVSPALFN